jgi:hypothetical protein
MPAAEQLTDTLSIARKNLFPAGRERGIYAVVEGGFAAGWFGWGQAAPPSWLVVPLGVGSCLGVMAALAGIVAAARPPTRTTAFSDRTVRRRFRIIVGVEFSLAGIGAAALAAAGQATWIPAWVCLVVGMHFLPLSRALGNRSLARAGALLTGVAAAALVVGMATRVAPSTVTGAGAGLCFLAAGLATLVVGERHAGRAEG